MDGCGVIELVSMADRMFGALTMIIYFVYLFFVCLGVFFASGLMEGMTGDLQ